MIARYTRPEMGVLWTSESRFAAMLKVEVAVAEAQAELGIIPKSAAAAIKKNGKFSVARIDEIEKTTKHDVIAFVTSVAENVGEPGRYVHFGMTSSDVLDTAMSLQVAAAGELLLNSMERLDQELLRLIKTHAETICAGRTHGMHAEPTTFGLKLAGFLAELRRNSARLISALEQMNIVKLSGAVGTYSAQPSQVEAEVAKRLGLTAETVATQVIPRDRHAELIWSLAMVGTGLERLAVELRHLQRTEVGEVVEGFTPGQKGSSAMPHKKNPISAENLTGAARLLRSYVGPTLEDVALWHERDISHSAVERVILPDAFVLCDYAVDRMASILKGLYVNVDRMRANMQISQGQLFSSHLLLKLVEKGLTRERAYELVQKVSHSLKDNENLRDAVLKVREIAKLIAAKEADEIFSGKAHREAVQKVIARVLGESNSDANSASGTGRAVGAKNRKSATSASKRGRK